MKTKTITKEEFLKNIEKDTSWASTIKSTVVVNGAFVLKNSSIKCLSSFLHFKGENGDGWGACFEGCKNLKEACGTFHHAVSFYECGIEKVDNLKILGNSNTGYCADFNGCENLKTAPLYFLEKKYITSEDLKEKLRKIKLRNELTRIPKKDKKEKKIRREPNKFEKQ